MSSGPDLKGATALVVGGAGFVGTALVRKLSASGCKEVVIVDNLLSADRAFMATGPTIRFIEGSIADDAILRSIPDTLDYAFHLATYHGNRNSIARPLEDHQHNTLTTLKLFERLSHVPTVKKVVYAGAGCTVAEKTDQATTATQEIEKISTRLDSPYQISKVVGEFYARYFHHQAGLPVVRARFQNVYGPGEVLGAGPWRGCEETVWRNVTPTFIYRALCHQALQLDNGGTATRDFIYVEDVAEGLIACALKGQPDQAYNIASGQETSIRTLAETINELTRNPTPPDILPARTWDRSGRRFGSTEFSKEALGFEASTDLKTGLKKAVDWYRDNLVQLYDVMARHGEKVAISAPPQR